MERITQRLYCVNVLKYNANKYVFNDRLIFSTTCTMHAALK